MNKLPSCRYDQWASTLLFLDLGLSHLSLLLAREGVYAPSVSRFTIGVSVGTVGLLVAVLVELRCGQRWAKLLYGALFLVSVLTLPLTHAVLFATPWATVRYVSHSLVQFVACTLLVRGFQADKRALRLQA